MKFEESNNLSIESEQLLIVEGQDEKGFACTGRAAGRGGTAVRVQRLRKADRRVCRDV